MDGYEKRKQMEESARLQRTQQRNGEDSFQDGQCLVDYGFDATWNVCNDIRFEKYIQSHKYGRKTTAIYGFPILGKGIQIHMDAIWMEPNLCDILQCPETSIERNQNEMEDRVGELYRRYTINERRLYIIGEGHIGNNRFSEQFRMENSNGEMYYQSNERVRIHQLEMEYRKIGGKYSLNLKKITEVENQELDEICGIAQENTNESDCIFTGRAKFLEDLVSKSIIAHAVGKKIESNDTQKREVRSLVRGNEDNSWGLDVVEVAVETESTVMFRDEANDLYDDYRRKKGLSGSFFGRNQLNELGLMDCIKGVGQKLVFKKFKLERISSNTDGYYEVQGIAGSKYNTIDINRQRSSGVP
ncbi:MAG: hypothetical protein EZS28_032865, partial [Streblomastix strix]